MQFRENILDINFTLVYNTSFLYVLQFQKRIMCIFWWHKFGLFVPSFMCCAIDKNVITIMGIHDYIYSSLVINGLNRHMDRYVMFQTVRKLHPAKTVVTHWWDKKILSQCSWIMSIWHRTLHSLIIYWTIGLSEHRYPYNTFGISSIRNKHLRTKESSEYRTFEL